MYDRNQSITNNTKEIIVSQMEHHSNFVPWQLAAKKNNADLAYHEK